MASLQERKFRFFPRLRKESQPKTDWQEFSFQIGRIMAGGGFNSQNPNGSNVGIEKWLSILVTSKKRVRNEGIDYLKKGIISVSQERIDKGDSRTDVNGTIMPLQIVADYLNDTIKPNIGKRGRHGDESMANLKALTTALYYCDKEPISIGNIIRPFALESLQR